MNPLTVFTPVSYADLTITSQIPLPGIRVPFFSGVVPRSLFLSVFPQFKPHSSVFKRSREPVPQTPVQTGPAWDPPVPLLIRKISTFLCNCIVLIGGIYGKFYARGWLISCFLLDLPGMFRRSLRCSDSSSRCQDRDFPCTHVSFSAC